MPTILVVDDEANIRYFVTVNLRARGYTTLEASSAEVALELLRDHIVDGLIVDIKLPSMSGWNMLRAIDNDPTLLKVRTIVMTASSTISQPDEYAYSQLVNKLAKPISLQVLLGAVQEIFN